MTSSARTLRFPTGVPGELTTYTEAWCSACDGILRGLAHALSNRVSTSAALAAFARDGDRGVPVCEMLADESARLDRMLHELRVIAGTGGEAPEPVRVADLAPALIALLRAHTEVHDTRCETADLDAAPPAWIARTPLARMLFLLMLAAARGAAREQPVRIGVREEDGTLVTTVARGTPPSTNPTLFTDGVLRLAAREGSDGVRYELGVLTLAEARRRGL